MKMERTRCYSPPTWKSWYNITGEKITTNFECLYFGVSPLFYCNFLRMLREWQTQ